VRRLTAAPGGRHRAGGIAVRELGRALLRASKARQPPFAPRRCGSPRPAHTRRGRSCSAAASVEVPAVELPTELPRGPSSSSSQPSSRAIPTSNRSRSTSSRTLRRGPRTEVVLSHIRRRSVTICCAARTYLRRRTQSCRAFHLDHLSCDRGEVCATSRQVRGKWPRRRTSASRGNRWPQQRRAGGSARRASLGVRNYSGALSRTTTHGAASPARLRTSRAAASTVGWQDGRQAAAGRRRSLHFRSLLTPGGLLFGTGRSSTCARSMSTSVQVSCACVLPPRTRRSSRLQLCGCSSSARTVRLR